MQNEPIEVTLKVTGILEKLGIPYLIGGSLASTLYGMVRTTQDSDIISEMRPEHIQSFVVTTQPPSLRGRSCSCPKQSPFTDTEIASLPKYKSGSSQ